MEFSFKKACSIGFVAGITTPTDFRFLGIGRSQQVLGGIEPEILVWSDQSGRVYPLPEVEIGQMRDRLKEERERAESLAEYLRS